jgi:hypothetical protein
MCGRFRASSNTVFWRSPERADDIDAGYRYQFLDYMHADLGVAVLQPRLQPLRGVLGSGKTIFDFISLAIPK